MNRGTGRRKRWFDLGADALERLRPERPRSYACPLCGSLFPPEALDRDALSVEHVPPQALGGRPLVLLCRQCNNRTGARIDAHAVEQAQLLDFAQGIITHERRVSTTASDRHECLGVRAAAPIVRAFGVGLMEAPPVRSGEMEGDQLWRDGLGEHQLTVA